MNKCRVVHLEDDSPLGDILRIAFHAAEPTVEFIHFTNSNDAWDYIAASGASVDLFILDVRVPGSMDGMEVACRIREHGCEGTVVITSAYEQPTRQILHHLNAEWFTKPWHIMELTQLLMKVAKRKQMVAVPS